MQTRQLSSGSSSSNTTDAYAGAGKGNSGSTSAKSGKVVRRQYQRWYLQKQQETELLYKEQMRMYETQRTLVEQLNQLQHFNPPFFAPRFDEEFAMGMPCLFNCGDY